MMKHSLFLRGMSHGIPIALGYLSVSFGFGIMAVKAGLSVAEASLISLTNLTSAGQAAGVDVIAASGSLLEMALVQLAINIRYALMALSLSQKLDESFTLPHRLLAAYGITDEIFGVCSAQERLYPAYMYGITAISAAGWVSGTFLGAAAGELLPAQVTAALGIVLYGMFIAIIVPPAKKERSILLVVLFAAALSLVCRYLLPDVISGGFAVILCSVAAAVFGALLFPREAETEGNP